MKPSPLSDEEVADLRQIREAYRAGRMLMLFLVGLGSIVGALGGVFTWWHTK